MSLRKPSLDEDGWALRNAEGSHEENPASFWIPDRDVRDGLKVGQAAKLIFEIIATSLDGNQQLGGERMWVIVSERVGDQYVGILDNPPASLPRDDDSLYLVFGAEIPFGPEHIIDTATPPEAYTTWQLSQPPERRWPRPLDDLHR
jgi:hypothetical protein